MSAPGDSVESSEDQTSGSPRRSPGQRLRRLAWRVLRLLLIAYLGLIAAAYFGQRYLAFPGSATPGAVARFEPPIGSTPLSRHTASGTPVSALFVRAFDAHQHPVENPRDYPTILYFYGNGQCMAYAQFEIDLMRRCGANVLVGDYPGYGLSSGTPSEQGCYELADVLWDYATTSPDIDPQRLVVVGWSLGGAVAIDLAHRHPVAGMMTVSTFTRMSDAGAKRFWFLPVRLLLTYRFDSIDKLADIRCPSLFIHGDADTFIPIALGRQLEARSPAAWKRFVPIPDAGHNEVFAVGYSTIQDQLTQLLSQATTQPSR